MNPCPIIAAVKDKERATEVPVDVDRDMFVRRVAVLIPVDGTERGCHRAAWAFSRWSEVGDICRVGGVVQADVLVEVALVQIRQLGIGVIEAEASDRC